MAGPEGAMPVMVTPEMLSETVVLGSKAKKVLVSKAVVPILKISLSELSTPRVKLGVASASSKNIRGSPVLVLVIEKPVLTVEAEVISRTDSGVVSPMPTLPEESIRNRVVGIPGDSL